MLKEHTKQKHTENFHCDLCGITFNNKCELKDHTDELQANKQVNNENEVSLTFRNSVNKPDGKIKECDYKTSSKTILRYTFQRSMSI